MRLTKVHVGVAAVVVAVLVTVGARWWTHPDVMSSVDGASFVANPKPLSSATAVQHYGLVLASINARQETVTIDALRAEFAENTAGARATAVVCTRRDVAEGTLTAGYGGNDADLAELCTDVTPFEPGTRLTVGGGEVPRRYLVWRIEATRPGTWLLGTTEVEYSRSWRHLGQRGTQRIASDVRFTFT